MLNEQRRSNICGVFSEIALLQRSSTPFVIWPYVRTVVIFHAHVAHTWHSGSYAHTDSHTPRVCTLVLFIMFSLNSPRFDLCVSLHVHVCALYVYVYNVHDVFTCTYTCMCGIRLLISVYLKTTCVFFLWCVCVHWKTLSWWPDKPAIPGQRLFRTTPQQGIRVTSLAHHMYLCMCTCYTWLFNRCSFVWSRSYLLTHSTRRLCCGNWKSLPSRAVPSPWPMTQLQLERMWGSCWRTHVHVHVCMYMYKNTCMCTFEYSPVYQAEMLALLCFAFCAWEWTHPPELLQCLPVGRTSHLHVQYMRHGSTIH